MLLQHRLPLQTRSVPAGFTVRPMRPEDAAALANLYRDSYPRLRGGVHRGDPSQRVETFLAGGCGRPIESACLVATDETGVLRGCVQTVLDSPRPGAPEGPFVEELFVHPDVRGRGLGTALLGEAALACEELGEERIALDVEPGDFPDAFRIYLSLGFVGEL